MLPLESPWILLWRDSLFTSLFDILNCSFGGQVASCSCSSPSTFWLSSVLSLSLLEISLSLGNNFSSTDFWRTQSCQCESCHSWFIIWAKISWNSQSTGWDCTDSAWYEWNIQILHKGLTPSVSFMKFYLFSCVTACSLVNIHVSYLHKLAQSWCTKSQTIASVIVSVQASTILKAYKTWQFALHLLNRSMIIYF